MSARHRAIADIRGGSLPSASETVLGVNAFNTVRRVNVLDQRELPAGGTALTGGDGRVGEEVFPDL